MKQNKTSEINHQHVTYESSDGLRLFEQQWQPTNESKAVVIIVHGLAEHSGRYSHVAEFLTHKGYAVDTFDLRGHGQSEGTPRIFINSFDEYLTDLDQFLDRVRQRHSGKPIFLLGHSMGGTVVSLYCTTRQPIINGVILSAPTLKISDDISPFLIKISGLLGRLFPKLKTIKLDSSAISRDPEVVKWYDTDPLNYRGGIPARLGAEFNQAIIRIQGLMEKLSLPLLILQGTADRLSDPEGSKQLYSRASAKDKTLKLYDDLYHEVLNEPEKEQVLTDIVQWLNTHISFGVRLEFSL